MKKYKWIIPIFAGLLIVFFSIFTRGAKNFAEIKYRLNNFWTICAENPKVFLVALAIGFFIGIIFWFIKTFGEKKEISTKEWKYRSIIILIVIFICIFLIIKCLEFFASRF